MTKVYIYIISALAIIGLITYGVFFVYDKGVEHGKFLVQAKIDAAVIAQTNTNLGTIKTESEQIKTVYLPGKTIYITKLVEVEKNLVKETVLHPELVTNSCFPDSTFKLLNDAINDPKQDGSLPSRPSDNVQAPNPNTG